MCHSLLPSVPNIYLKALQKTHTLSLDMIAKKTNKRKHTNGVEKVGWEKSKKPAWINLYQSKFLYRDGDEVRLHRMTGITPFTVALWVTTHSKPHVTPYNELSLCEGKNWFELS